ncbi:MAG: flavodoxin-dependent (E)-4-hydroxy-3-methylbut-2-enyl-diphosphate synthase [Clostridiales bacterium]|jgi:(E)-4-hydroxy-3-methylbut-2-enyl-diphosphate synthase|nr:flavodoxin-dependent (E)-4-hydroxy-3-methylbut-2-enyl-diphosphate synthase [Clostridiales bacterium]
MTTRDTTREVSIGGVVIGGGHPVAVQSMTKTDTRDIAATVEQIRRLTDAGCEIVRVAVPDMSAAKALSEIKRLVSAPLVADIHFDYRLAIAAVENGADKLRINPGNIGGRERLRAVVEAARGKNIPIRIGVNAGSLEKNLLEKYGGGTPEALAESALGHVKIMEGLGYENLVVSIKSSDITTTISAHELLARQVDYPLHIGMTEAGTLFAGSIRSAVGIGALLAKGLGDTVRVSLTGDPVEEIRCAREILRACKLRRFGVDFVSCPTCGRTEVNLIPIANEVYEYCAGLQKNIKVAVMGCAVNGPGEARDADIGVAAGRGFGLLFKNGQVVRKVPEKQLAKELIAEIAKL